MERVKANTILSSIIEWWTSKHKEESYF